MLTSPRVSIAHIIINIIEDKDWIKKYLIILSVLNLWVLFNDITKKAVMLISRPAQANNQLFVEEISKVPKAKIMNNQ